MLYSSVLTNAKYSRLQLKTHLSSREKIRKVRNKNYFNYVNLPRPFLEH